MKETYEAMKMEVITFDAEDIVRTSDPEGSVVGPE